MNIRKARISDYPRLAALQRETVRQVNSKDYNEKIISAWAKKVTAQRFKKTHTTRLRYVVEHKGDLIAYADMRPNGIFGGLYVDKDKRLKGAGTALLTFMEELARKHGVHTIRMMATYTSVSFFEKHGYTLTEKKTYHLNSGTIPMDILMMEKKLTLETTIRKAKPEDYKELAKLHRESIRAINGKDYPKNIVEKWSRRATAARFAKTHTDHIRFVAVQGKTLVGFCDMHKNGEFGGLYIHKDYVGGGIGSLLLKKMEETARARRVKHFRFESSITARPFYERHGYKVTGTTTYMLGGGLSMEAFLVEKKL